MNANSMEYLFGPPSEPIDVVGFITAAVDANSRSLAYSDDSESDQPQSVDEDSLTAQCSVIDLRDLLFDIWNNPKLSARLSKNHDHNVTSLYATTLKSAKLKRKAHLSDPDSLAPEVAMLQRNLDDIKLSCWKLQADSALFMRSSKNSDQNALGHVKPASDSSIRLTDDPQAIITVTVYDRLTWGSGHATRTSQHAFVSSQTLRDLFETIPCNSTELSSDLMFNHATRNAESQSASNSSGCVICIEGVAYGDGLAEEDYTDKLLKHLKTISKDPQPMSKGKTAIHDTSLSSLSLRINQPYWLMHQGNCEHFIAIDQIRLQHPSDVLSGYPLTLQLTPPLLDLCRACIKVPAMLSIVGDVRLGDSPCLICAPCWRNMGDPPQSEGVIIKSLPKY